MQNLISNHNNRGMNEKKQQSQAFREWYSRLGELRALVDEDVPVLCLTATAAASTRKTIAKVLSLKNPAFIEVNPDRPNIKYVVEKVTNDPEKIFSWVVDSLKKKGVKADKTIIYCRSLKDCGLVFDSFRVGLRGELSFVSSGCSKTASNRLYAMYYSSTEKEIKAEVACSFGRVDGSCRVVIATVALGMGLDFPDIRYVINFGPPNTIDQYVQQRGRVGRDGQSSKAYLVWHRKQLRTADAKMKHYVENTSDCRRKLLLQEFGWKPLVLDTPLHACCDICARKCACENDDCTQLLPELKKTTNEVKILPI